MTSHALAGLPASASSSSGSSEPAASSTGLIAPTPSHAGSLVASQPADAFEQNPVLSGHDPTEGIVAVEAEPHAGVRVWRRTPQGVVDEVVGFEPFVWVTDASLLEGGPPCTAVRELAGSGDFRVLARYASWDALAAARRHLQKKTGATPGSPQAPYQLVADPVHAYLLDSGRTFFKGLAFEQVVRLQLDIETYCAPGYDFSNPERDDDRIIAIGVATNQGFERLLWGGELAEKDMLIELGRLIAELDPDIIEGHNIFRFDLEYLRIRARRHGVALDWGRGGRPPQTRASRLQIAERTIDYTRYDIPGRHVLDTWLLLQHYDISHRSLPSFGLKDAARFFGLVSDDRTYIEGDRIAWTFDHEPERLRAYCLDDVRETRALSNLLTPIYHLQARIFPYSFQNVVLRGNATRIDALFVRAYLHQGQALPRGGSSVPAYEGGYADMYVEGVVGPVLHIDVQSLYPSLMLVHELAPRADELGVFLGLLRDLRRFRLQAKARAREATDPGQRAYFDALQSTFKVLINSFYGYLGTTFCHFSDGAAASAVTRHGRELVHHMIDWLRARGCQPVEVDTDGVYFLVEGADETDPDRLLAALSATLPEGIGVEISERYPAMLSYKVKNYALLDASGRVLIKGSGLRSRGIERYLRRFTEEMIGLLLHAQAAQVPALLERWLDDLARHRVPVRDLAKSETLTESLEAYRDKRDAGKRNKAAAYELALASGRPFRAGDAVAYYVTGKARKVKVYEQARLLSAFDAAAPDVNVAYYQDKLREHFKKFETCVGSPASPSPSSPSTPSMSASQGSLF